MVAARPHPFQWHQGVVCGPAVDTANEENPCRASSIEGAAPCAIERLALPGASIVQLTFLLNLEKRSPLQIKVDVIKVYLGSAGRDCDLWRRCST
jgi:hypothetical protein